MNAIEYILQEDNYSEQIHKIIKMNFNGSEFYNGSYADFDSTKNYLFFRGQSCYTWSLESKINIEKKRDNVSESEILIKFNEKYHCEKDKLIAFSQHYGEPTRGIDFTADFNIALFFACRENFDKDGCLWITTYIPHKSNWISSLTINLIATMNEKTMLCHKLAEKLIKNDEYKLLYSKRSNDFETRFICSELSSYLHSGFMVIYDYQNEETNRRIKLQKGSLFYCGSKFYNDGKECLNVITDTINSPYYKIRLHEINNPIWLENKCIKIKIPKNLKAKILKEINITANDLGL